jgi:nucleolar protein 4
MELSSLNPYWTSRENNIKLSVIKLVYIHFIFSVLDDENEQNDNISEKSEEEPSDQDGSDDGNDNDGDDNDGDDSDDGDNGEDFDDGDDDGGSDDDDDGDDDGGSDDESPKKKKRKLRDAREGKTIFIRNLPFDASEEEICGMFEKFGEIAYCKIVVDSVTEHSRGSAFVKFQGKQSADDCLKKHGDENDGSEGKNKTCLYIRSASSRSRFGTA